MKPTRATHAVVAASIVLAVNGMTGAAAGAATPTCSDTIAVEVHGQHVVADYVMGTHGITWPPTGGIVGDAIGGSGAAVPGGPGPGYHFPASIAPGASFCTDSRSPGTHL